MSRLRLQIKVTFEPTRRGLDLVRVAYQTALPQQRRVAEVVVTNSAGEQTTADGEIEVGRSL